MLYMRGFFVFLPQFISNSSSQHVSLISISFFIIIDKFENKSYDELIDSPSDFNDSSGYCTYIK